MRAAHMLQTRKISISWVQKSPFLGALLQGLVAVGMHVEAACGPAPLPDVEVGQSAAI